MMAEIVIMPKLGFDMAEGTLVRWLVSEGDPIEKGAILAEIETDKATVEVESTFTGVLFKQLVSEGEVVPINLPIAVIADAGEEVDLSALLVGFPDAEQPAETVIKEKSLLIETSEQKIEDAEEEGKLPGGVKASPLARRIAREMGINLKAVQGSGVGGRVVKKDIEAYITAPARETVGKEDKLLIPDMQTQIPITPVSLDTIPDDKLVPLNRLRAAIGQRMTEVKQTVPHFYVTHEYDMGAVMDLRKQINTMLSDDEKLSVNDFIVKAVALGLRQFPNLNASLQGDALLYHGHVNVGVAVAVEGGLLTVVCRDADVKSLRMISQEIRSMVVRARSGKVKSEDIEGSTFSISNLGMFDVEHFIAILNPPEAAILAVGSVRDMPIIQDGEIVSGSRMKATISVDHRVSDGAEAARFLQALANFLEEPVRLLL
jgi:pyruvate dehydrogenase E2 component (dihydrolipoamide acetyltransferase)